MIDCDAHIICNFIQTNCNILLIETLFLNKTEAVVTKIYKYLYIISVVIDRHFRDEVFLYSSKHDEFDKYEE